MPPATGNGAVRIDRDEVFLEYTKSICPVCKVVVDAEVNVRDNRVFLRRAADVLTRGDAGYMLLMARKP